MKTTLNKERSILRFLARLTESLGPNTFDIVDHWETDLGAIGITQPRKPGFLVYVSTFGQFKQNYFVSLELPPARGSDLPYKQGRQQQTQSFNEVLALIQGHLNL